MPKQDEFPHVREVFFSLCKAIDTPVSLGAWLRFEHNQLALAQMEIHPRDYLDASTFKFDYLVVSFLSKYKGLKTGLDLEAEALRKFTSSESHCAETNRRLREARKKGTNPFISSVLYLTKRKIAKLIGPFSLFCIEDKFGWGPGATDDIPRRRAFVDTKMCELPFSCTPTSAQLFKSIVEHDLHWSCVFLGVNVEDLGGPYCLLDSVLELTNQCVIETVPKNAKTHRVIAKEPRANGFLQKGVGAWFRKRLKMVGIDLDDQTVNQEGARRAFEDRLATLDLKSASDSTAIELVYELFPVDWAIALDSMRSPKALMPDGSTITLQKFSSMGNGFTFELESLIFWAITSSVTSLLSPGSEVMVYGDDIICTAEVSTAVIEALAFIGFQINEEKSFTNGAFYESCGKHYFAGVEVTPLYQKEPFHSDLETIRCGNRLLRYAARHGSGFSACREVVPAWKAAWRNAGASRVFQIPFGASGDDGWALPAEYFDRRPQSQDFGLSCRVHRPRKVSLPAHDAALLAWTLRRGVVTEAPYQGLVTSSPDTTTSVDGVISAVRWVMPSGEFDLSL